MREVATLLAVCLALQDYCRRRPRQALLKAGLQHVEHFGANVLLSFVAANQAFSGLMAGGPCTCGIPRSQNCSNTARGVLEEHVEILSTLKCHQTLSDV